MCDERTYSDISATNQIHYCVSIHHGNGLGTGDAICTTGDVFYGYTPFAIDSPGRDVGTQTHEGIVIVVKGHVVGVTGDPTLHCNKTDLCCKNEMKWGL